MDRSVRDAEARRDLERVIDEDDPEELLALLIELALSGEDRAFAEQCCVRLAGHRHVDVRGNAVLGLGHLARRFGALDRERVVPVVEAALRDAKSHVREQAEAAADDLEEHLGWRIERPR
jgi:hypothetical protein